MKLLKYLLAAIVSLILVSCASQKTTTSIKAPQTGKEFAIMSIDCQQKSLHKPSLSITITKVPEVMSEEKPEVITLKMICKDKPFLKISKLPTGTYKIDAWKASDSLNHVAQSFHRRLYFTIKNNEITYLGRLQFSEHNKLYKALITQAHLNSDITLVYKRLPRLMDMPVRHVYSK